MAQFKVSDAVKYDGNRFGRVLKTTTEMLGYEGTEMVQILTSYNNKVWFEASYLTLVN